MLPEVSFWCGRGVEVMVQGCNEGCCLRWASGVGVEWRLWFKAAMRDAAWGELLVWAWSGGYGSRLQWGMLPEVSFWCGRGVEVMVQGCNEGCLSEVSFWCGRGVEARVQGCNEGCCLRWASGVGVEWRLWFKAAMRDTAWGELLVWAWSGGYGSRLQWGMLAWGELLVWAWSGG